MFNENNKEFKITYKWIINIILLAIAMKCYNIFFTENNTCSNFDDYFLIDTSPNCYHNPDVGANTPEILSRLVGHYENHTVTTEDGFHIHIFRIPNENPKGVIILQHPVTIDAIIWVGQNDTSLGYLLWKMGYDIWMPNQRGTYFSNKHVNYTIDDFEFWDYTFEDIGLYDYSAVFKYISNATNRNDLIFIGHSMATTASLIYASLKPEEANQHVQIFIELSPVAYLSHMTSQLGNINTTIPKLKEFYKKFGIHHLFRHDGAWGTFTYLLGHAPFKKIVGDHLNSLMGTSENEFDPRWYTVLHSQLPRAFSMKLANHYAQLTKGVFQRYDYGIQENLKRYNSTIPPEYPVQNIKTPVYLITSLKDTIATVEDAEDLYSRLSDEAKVYGRNITDVVNHIEFHFGKRKMKYAYEPIFEILDKLNET